MYDARQPAKENDSFGYGRDDNSFVKQSYNSWMLGLPDFANPRGVETLPTILAVGGGKGGVGKSIVSANYSSMLAQNGHRVLVIDMDLGCSNLHTHFGTSVPKKSVTDFLRDEDMQFKDVILPAPIQGVAFVAGGREEDWGELFGAGKEKYFKRLIDAVFDCKKKYNVDFVVLDLGAGTHKFTMDFFSLAHLGIITVLPEPTSIENAYVFLKMALWKILTNLGDRTNNKEIVEEVLSCLSEVSSGNVNQGYADCLRQLRSTYPDFIALVAEALRGRLVGIIVNQTRDQTDMDIGRSMEHICQRYFGFQCKNLGFLNYDESVWKSLKNRRLLITDFPHSLISKRLAVVAANSLNLLGLQGG